MTITTETTRLARPSHTAPLLLDGQHPATSCIVSAELASANMIVGGHVSDVSVLSPCLPVCLCVPLSVLSGVSVSGRGHHGVVA